MKIFVVLFLTLLTCGCAKLAHLQELLTLKGFSDNQTEQTKYLEAQDKKFKALLAAVGDGTIGRFRSKKSFLRNFGDPILAHKVNRDGVIREEWLYRYARKFMGSEKVCVYFDASGRFVDFRHINPKESGK